MRGCHVPVERRGVGRRRKAEEETRRRRRRRSECLRLAWDMAVLGLGWAWVSGCGWVGLGGWVSHVGMGRGGWRGAATDWGGWVEEEEGMGSRHCFCCCLLCMCAVG